MNLSQNIQNYLYFTVNVALLMYVVVQTAERRAADTPPRQAPRPRASTMHPRRAAIEVEVRRALEPTRRIGTLPLAPRDAVAEALRAQSQRREQD